MARKKREIPDNALVQKAKPMFLNIWKEKDNISLFEYKVLDLYMASINSHDVESREVTIDMKHLNDLIGKHFTSKELDKHLNKVLSIIINYEKDKKVVLFERSEIVRDETNEPMQIKLKCTETAEKYFFNIDKIGYFKYKLKNTLAIKSLYAYLMFNYLEMNRFRTTWEVSVEELKKILQCTDNDLYSAFYRFNDKVLKSSYNELTEQTELRYSYETVKHGRHVVAIRFTLEPLNIEQPKIPMTEPITAPVQEEQQPLLDMIESKYADFFVENFGDDFFETIYRDEISDQLTLLKIDSDESRIDIILKRSIERFKIVISKTKISDNDKYFRKIIESECINAARLILNIQQPKPDKPEPEQRKEQSYDIDEFEKFAVTFSKNTKKQE